jgi:hypothetical protein
MKDVPPERARSQIRQERLARALRENLKRRKAQARGRRTVDDAEVDACKRLPQVPISPDGRTTNGGERG